MSAIMVPMARPREFDEDTVLGLARDAFWADGVSATSVTMLCDATGLTVGSIYKAFHTKDEMYRRTLDDYLVAGLKTSTEVLTGAETAIDGVSAWLELMAVQAASETPICGCYAVQAAIELAATDEWVRTRLRRHDEALRSQVAAAARAAIAAGDLDGDPTIAARVLCSAVNGIQVEARKGISLDDARQILDHTLRAFRP